MSEKDQNIRISFILPAYLRPMIEAYMLDLREEVEDRAGAVNMTDALRNLISAGLHANGYLTSYGKLGWIPCTSLMRLAALHYRMIRNKQHKPRSLVLQLQDFAVGLGISAGSEPQVEEKTREFYIKAAPVIKAAYEDDSDPPVWHKTGSAKMLIKYLIETMS